MQKKVEDIVREVANKYGVPFEVAKAAWEAQFECAKNIISNADVDDCTSFKNIRLTNLGLLYSRWDIINAIKHARNGTHYKQQR